MGKTGRLLITAAVCAAVVAAFACKRLDEAEKTLDELQFLTADEAVQRPLYNKLTDEQKADYTAVYRGICGFQQEIELPHRLKGPEYAMLYKLIEKQESELFYLDSTYYIAEEMKKAKIAYREDSPELCGEMKKELDEKVREIIAGAPAGDDFAKALYIHDYIIKNCNYNLEERRFSSTSYGCLVEGEALCEGYAKAFDLLAKELGLPSVLVTGVDDSNGNHAWNQVKINGDWYNTDVTWDDMDSEQVMRHTYFLCSDSDFLVTHTADADDLLPYECTETKNNYYVKKDIFIRDWAEAERIVRKELASNSNPIELKFADNSLYQDFKNTYIDGEKIFEIMTENLQESRSFTINVTDDTEENCLSIWLK